jgi:hypothetical protein
VLAEEMTIVMTMDGEIDRGRVVGAHGEINVDKIPTRAQGTGGPIGDEEEAIRGRGDGREECGRVG